jgi:murein DD-endopeptidase MepM/ murein hydrolase activator NlpD
MKSLYFLLFCLPLKHLELTSAFGYRIHPITKNYTFHSGIDLRAHQDTVYAICGGVAAVYYDQLLGLNIKIADDSLCCIYGHLSQVFGSGNVTKGTPIGITGSTGRVTGEHLHLAIKYQGCPLDPLKFLYELIKSNNYEQ